jgi:hypothetical protein
MAALARVKALSKGKGPSSSGPRLTSQQGNKVSVAAAVRPTVVRQSSSSSESNSDEEESNVFQINREFARQFNQQAEETELIRSTWQVRVEWCWVLN